VELHILRLERTRDLYLPQPAAFKIEGDIQDKSAGTYIGKLENYHWKIVGHFETSLLPSLKLRKQLILT